MQQLYPVGSVNRGITIQFSHGKLQAFSPEFLIHGYNPCQIWRTTEGIGPRLVREKDGHTQDLFEYFTLLYTRK